VKLYSGPLSLFSAKVRIALAEKGIAYERVEVPFGRARGYEPKHPQVLAHNPKAQVPVLVDGDLVLYDSTLIVEYLDERVPDPPLLPREPRARARCRLRELHADEVLFPQVWVLIRQVFYTPETGRDAGEIAAARAGIEATYAELDAELAERDWLGADAFSAADVAYALTAFFASQLGAPVPERLERLDALLARCAARPSVARDIQEMAKYAAELSA
jgi:glutathione S-transferase